MVQRKQSVDFLSDVFTDGYLNPSRMSSQFHTTKKDLADSLGLSIDAVSKKNRVVSVKTQARLSEASHIINRVTTWAGSPYMAWAWYRSQPLPSFGGKTAEDLVKEGRGDAIRRYLSRINVGGYA